MSHVVAGIFRDEASASDAVARLVEAHFDPERDIRIIASHHREHEEVPVVDRMSVWPLLATGIATGVLVGAGVLGAAAAGVFPNWTPENTVAWGAFQGAYVGGAMGALAGGLFGLGVHRFYGGFAGAHVHDGVVWVGVTAGGEARERARQVLADAGARHFVEKDE